MTNRLIVIGEIGMKRAYLNVPQEEAIRRYREAHPDETRITVQLVEFEDEFEAYEIWEPR